MTDTLAYNDGTPDAPAPEPINYSTSNVSVLPDEVLGNRANRADFALGDKSPGQTQLKDAFRSGQEPQVRQQAAADANIDFQEKKLNQIKAAASQGTPITDEDVNKIMSLGSVPESNPSTVLEDKFGTNMVTTGVIGDPGKNLVFQSAFDEVPDRTREGVQIASAAVSRKTQAQGLVEEAQPIYDAIPLFSAKGDQTSRFGSTMTSILTFGMAQAVNQRNLINASPTNSILPGANKLEQIQALYLLPHDDFLPALRAAAGPGSELWKRNPGDALDFLRSAVQYGTSDAYADNLLAVTNVAGLLPVGTFSNGIRRLVMGRINTAGVQTLEKGIAAAQGILKESPFPPVKPLSPAGQGAADTAASVLAGDGVPPTPRYYVPEAAVKRPWESAPRTADITIQNGEPLVRTEDGAIAPISRTPQEGHIPFSIENRPGNATYTTKHGTFEYNSEGVMRNGQEDPQRTIYVNQKDHEKLSQVLDEDKNSILLDDNKGFYVGNKDIKYGNDTKETTTVGKEIKGSRVPASRISDTPKEGLYPIHVPEGNDKMNMTDFGARIERIDNGPKYDIKFGPTITSKADVEARVAIADIVKSQAETDPVDVLSKMGQHEAGATMEAGRKVDDFLGQVSHSGDVEYIRRQVPSLGSPQTYYGNASSLTRERADRLATEALSSSSDLISSIVNPARVERLTQAAKDKAIEIAKAAVREKYNRNADAILDQVGHWDSASNLHYVETRFGKKDGTLFDTSEQAQHFKDEQYKLGDAASVKQEGTQFYIAHTQHADETQSGVRGSLIVSGNETPRGWWNSLMTAVTGKFAPLGSSLRSSAYTVSPFQMNNRVISTHAPSIMRDAIEKTAEDIRALGKWTTNERQEMQTILEHNRDYMSPEGVRGQFYKSAFEFETEFNTKFGKMPTEKQIVAYDQFTRLSDFDWTLRELDLMRDKARQGVRNYRVSFTKNDESGIPGTAQTDWWNGKHVKDFDPLNTQNANIYIMPENKFTSKFGKQGSPGLTDGSAFSEAVNDKLKSGEYQILQVYNPREKPLRDATGIKDDIHFVVTNKFDDKAVSFGENVPYRPGGHVIYQDQHYIKQPQIGPGTNGRQTHFGDTSIKAFSTEREAKEWADKYNIVREMIRTGDDAGLNAYVAAGNMPETVPDLKRLFSDGTLSPDHPIVHTFAGRDTFQSSEDLARSYPGLKDQFSSYNLSQVQGGDFLADRGAQLNTVANKGTEANPIYTNVPSRLFDPYTSLQKGMAQIARNRWMGDYKISAAESWVQEFGLLFDQSKLPIEKLRQNPTYWLYHAEGNIDAGVMKTNPELVTAAMTSRKNIMNFIGARDEVGAILEGLEKKVVDKIAGFSPTWARRTEETFLPAIKEAPAYARSAAFDAVIGTFNPVQLFQQAGGLVHVMALAPQHAWQSTTMSALVRLYRHTEDPAILSSMLDKAVALGWDRDMAQEAFDSWKNTGTHKIGGETSLLSTTGDPQLFRNGAQTLINKGRMFFNAGESIVRDTSWFTAYREWRTANPDKALDNRALGDIGNRFQVLSLDMTRASNSALNEGILSIPTQFWTWNARFTEQMLGKRLTMGEKARVFAAYSAMYGIPATLGGVTFGTIPYANYGDIREYALANNINVSNKGYQLLSEGIPSAIMNAISGHETSLQRFSPNATQLKDIMDGKKDAYEMLGGASGSFVAQVVKTVWPAFMYGFSAFKKDSGFPLKWNDLTNLAKNVSSFNNGEKAVIAWNTGTYVGKTEGLLASDVDRFESMALALGLNPQRVNDAYTKVDFIKHQEDAQKKLGKKMTEDWTIAMKAGLRGDYQTMTDYMTRVHSWTQMGNFTKQQELDLYKQATHSNESLVDSVNRRFLEANPNLQNIPAYQQYLKNRQQ